MNRLKKAWKSLTIWFNSAALSLIPAVEFAKDSFPEMQSYVDHGFYKWVMGTVVAVNILLRFKTNKDLADK